MSEVAQPPHHTLAIPSLSDEACVYTCKSKDLQMTTDWGWQECDEGFVPLQTSAPEHMLKVIRCNCQADCSTRRCTCKRHNIECTPACGNCWV